MAMDSKGASEKAQVVVTGLGCISALGKNVSENWNALMEGKSGVSQISNIDTSRFDVKIASEIKDFDPSAWLPKKEQKRMDRFIQLGLAATKEAIEDADFSDAVDPARVGVVLSSGIGGLAQIEETAVNYHNGGRVSAFFIPSVISNLLPGQVSIRWGYKGPNYCTVSACSSSAHAVGEGMRMLQRGEVDVAVVGGAEAPITPIGVNGFAAMKALSKRNDDPAAASRPFDQGRDGFVMGEGGATLILERLENAKARGAKIYATVSGYGSNSDAYHLTAPCENGEGAAECMKIALKDAGMDLGTVDYINLHGTSTKQGDIAESRAIQSVFSDRATNGLFCSSTKSMTGHLLGAAGSYEAMAVALALKESVIPPTINLDNQDPECRLDYTAKKARKTPLKAAMSNSFGFGGTNVSLVFEKYEG